MRPHEVNEASHKTPRKDMGEEEKEHDGNQDDSHPAASAGTTAVPLTFKNGDVNGNGNGEPDSKSGGDSDGNPWPEDERRRRNRDRGACGCVVGALSWALESWSFSYMAPLLRKGKRQFKDGRHLVQEDLFVVPADMEARHLVQTFR